MASIKDLKREINDLVVHIIELAFRYQVSHPNSKGYKEADKIIEDAVALRDDVMGRIYKASDLEQGELKPYFGKVREDFQKTSLDLINRLDKLPE